MGARSEAMEWCRSRHADVIKWYFEAIKVGRDMRGID
jgi:hypothetical protein